MSVRSFCLLVVLVVAVMAGGCATITGTATGALTGMVDLPVETYRQNRAGFHEYPILFGLDAIVLGPVGLVTGPLFGFTKGLSLDIQWVSGQVSYGDVFGSTDRMSIWRPHTLQWPSRGPAEPP